MKRWLPILLGIFIGIPVLAILVGLGLPRDHVAHMVIDLDAPPEKVWALVSDFAGTPAWRTDVTSVRMDTAGAGAIRFTESSSQGDVPFEVVSQDPPRRQVVRVIDDEQPFGGTWTWEIEAAGAGSRLILTEAGFIKNPLFRTMGALFFSPTDTMNTYLRALAKALGDDALPRELKRSAP